MNGQQGVGKMILKYMTEEDAQNICNWEYLEEYSIYNIGGWEQAINNNWAITKERIRKQQFRVIYDDNHELLGYIRFKEVNKRFI